MPASGQADPVNVVRVISAMVRVACICTSHCPSSSGKGPSLNKKTLIPGKKYIDDEQKYNIFTKLELLSSVLISFSNI